MSLNEKQTLFCYEYLKDLNLGLAAQRAGYAVSTSFSMGSKLYDLPEVKSLIEKLKADRVETLKFTANEVLYRLSLLARGNLHRFFKKKNGSFVLDIPEDLTEEDMYPISEIVTETYFDGRGQDKIEVKRTRIKMESRLKALELAGKHVFVKAFDDVISNEVDEIIIRNMDDVIEMDKPIDIVCKKSKKLKADV